MSRLAARFIVFAVLASCVAVAGCDRSSSPTATPSPLVSASVDEDLYDRINASRAANNVLPVQFDTELSRLAEQHSRHMLTEGGLTHTDVSGNTIGDRLGGAGVVFTRAAENIGVAFGYADPAAYLHQEFMDSPPHRKIILDPSFTEVGIGYVISGDETWVSEIFVRP